MSFDKSDSRILIVDDTPKNIQVLGSILRKESYKLNVAQNGLQALEILKKIKPDLILLDIMMPELDGFETCKRMKQDDDLKDIPVIFLTAKVDIEDVVLGFELGAVDYVTKPFNSTELLVRVETQIKLKKASELVINQAKELKEWNESLESKLDQRTKEIHDKNKELMDKNLVLESQGKLVTYILDVHEFEESLEFIINEIMGLVNVDQLIVYALPENEIYKPLFGAGKTNDKVKLIDKGELGNFPELPTISGEDLTDDFIKGKSDENNISENSMFLPLVRDKELIGYILLENVVSKVAISDSDVRIVSDFATLVSIVVSDYVITQSPAKLNDSIEDILKGI